MDGHRIRSVGSKASLEWWDRKPDELRYEVQGEPIQTMIRAMPYLDEQCNADERLGALHAEGLSDAWANIYLKFAVVIEAKNRGDEKTLQNFVYPDIDAGIDGIRWIENYVRSAENYHLKVRKMSYKMNTQNSCLGRSFYVEEESGS